MNTEIYIENYRLDVSADISSLLNFAIDVNGVEEKIDSWLFFCQDKMGVIFYDKKPFTTLF